jgi:hypothetical protein
MVSPNIIYVPKSKFYSLLLEVIGVKWTIFLVGTVVALHYIPMIGAAFVTEFVFAPDTCRMREITA